jgi:hypothetical protein
MNGTHYSPKGDLKLSFFSLVALAQCLGDESVSDTELVDHLAIHWNSLMKQLRSLDCTACNKASLPGGIPL